LSLAESRGGDGEQDHAGQREEQRPPT